MLLKQGQRQQDTQSVHSLNNYVFRLFILLSVILAWSLCWLLHFQLVYFFFYIIFILQLATPQRTNTSSPSSLIYLSSIWCGRWLICLIRVRSRGKGRGGNREGELGNRKRKQNGRVWSLCWIAPEIGSINLHTASHACNDTDLAKQATAHCILCPQDRDAEPPAHLWDCPHTVLCYNSLYHQSKTHLSCNYYLHQSSCLN